MSEQDLNKQNKEEQNLTSEQVSKTLEEAVNVPQKQPKAHVRTFAKDVAEQMRDNSTSVVKIALAEQNRQKEYETIVKSTKKQQIIFLSLTFVFIVGGAILLAFAMSNKNSDVPVPSLVLPREKANSIIFSEQQELVDITDFSRAETIESILTNVNFVRDAGITNILTTVQSGASVRTMYGSEFLTRIATNIPETTVPLMGNNFMIGVDGNNNFTLFLVFSFDNFDGVVDGFREWEPFLVQDMNRMLKINTGGKSIEVFSKPFQSEILFNKESRVLRDENQGFVVGYTFLDRNNLVITTNIKTIEEVVKRFSVQEIK